MTTETKKKYQGFASMTPERRREIASLGGKRAHEMGKAHKWDAEQAREMGKLGGVKSRRGPAKEKEVDKPTPTDVD